MTRKKKPEQDLYVQASAAGLTYTGQDGQHVTGIPARDIAPHEISLIGPLRLPDVLASGLYTLNEVSNG